MTLSKVEVLIIEGKRSDKPSFSGGLIKRGFSVTSLPNGSTALNFLKRNNPHLIIIDAASMRTTGSRICTSINEKKPRTPLIHIVEDKSEVKKIEEADIVLVMPFTLQKLLNRIKPFVNRNDNKMLEVGPLKLDLEQRWIYCGDKNERLTPRLFILMKSLMQKPGKLQKREDLFKKLWETEYVGDMRSLDVHISWLRKAIEDNPRLPIYIKTKRGVGYYLDVEE